MDNTLFNYTKEIEQKVLLNFSNLTQKLSLFIIIILISFFLSACTEDKHNHPNLSTGEEYYNAHCSECHSKNGTGIFLKGTPANIATKKNKREIILHIEQGSHINHAQMPIFADMPNDEVQKIAFHLLHLKKSYFDAPENESKVLLKR